MKLRLRKEIMIIGIHEGIFAMPHMKYERGRLMPVCSSQPSNGWKAPSYGAVSLYFSFVWSSAISNAVTSVRLSMMKRTVVAGFDWPGRVLGRSMW